jgi:transposase-like protein
MSILSEPHFRDEAAAVARLEAIVWPTGPVCPHCGNADAKRIYSIKGKTARPGLRTCAECRKQFTCKIGTVFESSHVPLHKWFQAAHLLASSKKGFSAHQLHRTLKVTYKTAWFMFGRLREAMRQGELALPSMGSGGKAVEADETFIGHKKGFPRNQKGIAHKFKIMSLVERGGHVRSVVIDAVSRRDVEKVIRANVSHEARLFTDTARYYAKSGFGTASHEMVNHQELEYVRGEAHTNTLEGYYSIFKRGMKGIYQHCSEKHLHRYVAEYDFRYNHRTALGVDDEQRTVRALEGIKGKRLYFRQPA